MSPNYFIKKIRFVISGINFFLPTDVLTETLGLPSQNWTIISLLLRVFFLFFKKIIISRRKEHEHGV